MMFGLWQHIQVFYQVFSCSLKLYFMNNGILLMYWIFIVFYFDASIGSRSVFSGVWRMSQVKVLEIVIPV